MERVMVHGLIGEVSHDVGVSAEVSRAHVKAQSLSVSLCAYRTALSDCSST